MIHNEQIIAFRDRVNKELEGYECAILSPMMGGPLETNFKVALKDKIFGAQLSISEDKMESIDSYDDFFKKAIQPLIERIESVDPVEREAAQWGLDHSELLRPHVTGEARYDDLLSDWVIKLEHIN